MWFLPIKKTILNKKQYDLFISTRPSSCSLLSLCLEASYSAAPFPEISSWNHQNVFLSARLNIEVVLVLGGILHSLIWQQITC